MRITTCILRAAITKYHKLGRLDNRNVLSPGSGGWNSKIMEWAGLVLSEGCEGACAPGLSPGLLNGHLLPVSSPCLPSVHVHPCVQIG